MVINGDSSPTLSPYHQYHSLKHVPKYYIHDEAPSAQGSQSSILQSFTPGQQTIILSFGCTKRSSVEDEHMNLSPCMNIMVQWLQAERELSKSLSKF